MLIVHSAALRMDVLSCGAVLLNFKKNLQDNSILPNRNDIRLMFTQQGELPFYFLQLE